MSRPAPGFWADPHHRAGSRSRRGWALGMTWGATGAIGGSLRMLDLGVDKGRDTRTGDVTAVHLALSGSFGSSCDGTAFDATAPDATTPEERWARLVEARSVDGPLPVRIVTDPLVSMPSSESRWDVPVAEVSRLESTRQARQEHETRRVRQRQ